MCLPKCTNVESESELRATTAISVKHPHKTVLTSFAAITFKLSVFIVSNTYFGDRQK